MEPAMKKKAPPGAIKRAKNMVFDNDCFGLGLIA